MCQNVDYSDQIVVPMTPVVPLLYLSGVGQLNRYCLNMLILKFDSLCFLQINNPGMGVVAQPLCATGLSNVMLVLVETAAGDGASTEREAAMLLAATLRDVQPPGWSSVAVPAHDQRRVAVVQRRARALRWAAATKSSRTAAGG